MVSFWPHFGHQNDFDFNFSECEASLIIKPHGLGKTETMKTLKSKVLLKAFAYQNFQVSVLFNEKPLESVMSFDDRSLRIRVKNQGDCAAYFKMHQDKFVLAKNEEKRLKLNLSEKFADVNIFYGPEISRQIFKNSAYQKENFEDFKTFFESEKKIFATGNFHKNDCKYFFNNFKVENVKIQVVNEFFPLKLTEEKSIYLENSQIYFPTVTQKNGISVAKITIKNRSQKSIKFKIDALKSPFETRYTEVEVKPRFYLSIPIVFRPTYDKQKCCCLFVLKSEERTLQATLNGSCQYIH